MTFIIHALPRSRTAWMAAFLSYGDWKCGHEQAVTMRSFDDVRELLTKPQTGTAETATAQGRALIKYVNPEIKEVVILRPVEDVIKSILAIPLDGVAVYDEKILRRNMVYGDNCLRKIAKDPAVLVMLFDDLETEDGCRKLWEHCLPYEFDRDWWMYMKNKNIQIDVKEHLLYYFANRDAIDGFKKCCKDELRKLVKEGKI